MSGYIGTQPVPQATQTRDSFTCTAGQTSFATSGYSPSFLDVYLNGVKLTATDYTASNGSDVVLASGAAAGDVLEVVAFTTFDVVTDTITAAGTALTLDRTGSDGTILGLKKDGTTVGSIKSRNSESLMIGSDYGSDAYICLSNDNVFPVTSTGAVKDAATNLGVSTGRWKDLYLSGGVYLGGTGSANKLDDYESGTFIPTFQSITNPTYVVRVGYYIKIGSFVSYQYRIEWSAGTSIGSTVNGLPFAARNGQDEYPMTSNVYHAQGVTYSSSRTTAIGYVLKNTANMDLVCIGSAQTVGSLTFSTSGSIYVTGQYYTNS